MTSIELFNVARQLGFQLQSVQKCPDCGQVSTKLTNSVVKYCKHCEHNVTGGVCYHGQTDATIDMLDCQDCGVARADFIRGAQDTIREQITFLEDVPCVDYDDYKAKFARL
jgi:ribosomal protein L37AE/L43A